MAGPGWLGVPPLKSTFTASVAIVFHLKTMSGRAEADASRQIPSSRSTPGRTPRPFHRSLPTARCPLMDRIVPLLVDRGRARRCPSPLGGLVIINGREAADWRRRRVQRETFGDACARTGFAE